MAELDRQLLTMKFELAFEVEKAVLNGDLEPFEIQSLGSTIHALSSTASFEDGCREEMRQSTSASDMKPIYSCLNSYIIY
jgi:hypothetical protein